MPKRINKDDIDRFHDYSLYIPKRTLYMGSEHVNDAFSESSTDTSMAERQIKNLLILDSMSQEPITIIMNNLGGDVNHGLAIYDAVITCQSHITIRVLGNAMSMGSVILQAADERIMSPNAVQMMHYGSVVVEGDSKIVNKMVKENERQNKWMEVMYLAKIQEKQSHYTLARLQRLLTHDTYLTAQESVALGLADKILGEE